MKPQNINRRGLRSALYNLNSIDLNGCMNDILRYDLLFGIDEIFWDLVNEVRKSNQIR